MKILALAFASLVCVPIAAFSQAPIGPGSVKLGKVSPEGVKTPEYQVTGGQNKRYKIGTWLEFEIEFETKPEEIDELTFTFTALIEGKLLTGEVSYVNVAKGKDHFAVMYLSPKSIEKLTGGKTLSPAGIQNVWVKVERQGMQLDPQIASHKPGAIPNAAKLSGLLLNKSQTPFAPLYYDRYEEIKPAR